MNHFLRLYVLAFVVCACLIVSCPGNAQTPAHLSTSVVSDVGVSGQKEATPATTASETATIPGPLHSFLRMAGISQKAPPEEVLPLLGHFVETYGYEGWNEKSPRPTEALTLLRKYVDQARELQFMAGAEGTLRFTSCEGSKPLLTILGYRLKDGCKPGADIEVSDPERSFLTLDSGFPLVDLEDALNQGKPFRVAYTSSQVPLIWSRQDWIAAGKPTKNADVIDALMNDPVLARLYWALSQVDVDTREQVYRSIGVRRLLPVAPALDFYGAGIYVRNGRVAVPGGSEAEAPWKRVVGADPGSPSAFIERLLEEDKGRLAQFYDSIARAPEPQQAYFTGSGRIERFYRAFRQDESSGDAVKSIFRPGADLLLLTTRMPLNSNGEPHVPGNLAVWKEVFRQKKLADKNERTWAKKASSWKTTDDLVEALVGLSRSVDSRGPLQVYLTLNNVDRSRSDSEKINPETTRLMASHFTKFRDQYEVFAEFTGLNDASISRFIRVADQCGTIQDPLVRGDAIGILEANIGLWEIFVRQGQIPASDLNGSWQRTINFFGNVTSSAQLFDATESSLSELMKDATGKADFSEQKIVELLAGPEESTADGQQMHDRTAARIRAVLTDQRLVSLDTLHELGDLLRKRGHVQEGIDTAAAAQLADELEETREPRAMFTQTERLEWAPGHWQNKHILAEMRTDMKKELSGPESADTSTAMRGELTPFLRDVLVGFNYAYYEPPGGQILHNSPMLVRSHDFLASESVTENRSWLEPEIFGIGVTAGNGAHLSGSLAGLPYVLAAIEQDFIVPENVQALIWHETAAELLTTAVLPRWWTTSPEELHAAALYQKAGEDLITEASKNSDVRTKMVEILYDRVSPVTMDKIQASLAEGNAQSAMSSIAPAATFYLAVEYRKEFPGKTPGAAAAELDALALKDSSMTSPQRIEEDFGIPHPRLTQSYANDMLNMKPFPSVMGYASELLAESWESTNLYWARLADELGYSPVMLNQLVPVLTRRMVEKIFASDFDDWSALVRAMRETGEEFRKGEVAGLPKASAALRP